MTQAHHMRFKLFIILLAFAFALSACAAQTGETTAAPSPEAATASVPPTASTPGCSSFILEPTPTAALSFVPEVNASDYSIGPNEAAVTLVEYCDFQSPICQATAASINKLLADHPKDVRLVFRPVPLIDILDKSELAMQAALAAEEQGKFWEMYHLLFEKNTEWAKLSPTEFKAWIVNEAAGLGLDGNRFQKTMNAPETAARIKSMYEAARQIPLQTVPLILINGSPQPSYAIDYYSLESTVSLIALGKRQYTQCPPFSVDVTKHYIATLETEKGNIVIQLYADKAPLAVNSFVFLARQGWFDGVTFHRVIPGFVAQTGDPSGTSRGGPGYFFKDEINPALKYDKPGVVGMANSGPDTNGSQFFITYAPQPGLDGKYTIFGQVISGMDVLESLTPRDPQQGLLPPGDKLLHVTIEEK